MPLEISSQLAEEIRVECEKQFPYEACGLLIGKDGKAHRFIPCENKQNELHEKNPARYPRDAKTAYVIDPKQYQEIEKNAASEGLEIINIVHSHPNHDVYFSKEDEGNAAPWGEPLFPKISYLVVSVYDGKQKNCSEFYWDSVQKKFCENKII